MDSVYPIDVSDVIQAEDICATPWDQTHFYHVSKPWRDLGYAVIPSDGPTLKNPLAWRQWRQWCGEGRQPVPESTWRDWCSRYGDHEGLLLLDSSTGGLPDLIVVDVDDPAWGPWALEQFGEPVWTVSSGREGGGVHRYYAVPRGESIPQANGMIGPTELFKWIEGEDGRPGRWKGYLDLKSARSFVVAPGSMHKTGRVYTGSSPLTAELLRSLTQIPLQQVSQLVRTCKPDRPPHGVGGSGSGGSGGHAGPGRYRRLVGDGKAVIPGPGIYAGMAIEQAVARLVDGQKIVCGCPYHPSVSGKSASLRRLPGGGWRLSCHVEQATYQPETIVEVAPAPVSIRAAPVEPPPVIDIEDLTSGPEWTLGLARRLLWQGRWEEVLALAEEAREHASWAMGELVMEALGMAEEADREEQEQEAVAMLREELEDAYGDRLRKKETRAARVPAAVRLGAEDVLELAQGIVRAVRARRVAQGLPGDRVPGAPACGVPLCLQHGRGGAVLGPRVCRDDACPRHGPWRQAQRIMATAAMPLWDLRTGSVGAPMGRRELHLYDLSGGAKVEASFLQAWERRGTILRGNSSMGGSILPLGQEEFPLKIASVDGYCVFDLGGGKKVALTTLLLHRPAGGRGRPSALAPAYLGPVPASKAEAKILELGLAAVRAVPSSLQVEGMGAAEQLEVVVGAMTTSQTLHLDPQAVASTAQAAPWLAVGEITPSELAAGLRAARGEAPPPADLDPDELVKIAPTSPSVVADVVRARGRLYGTPRPRRGAPVIVPEVDLDCAE